MQLQTFKAPTMAEALKQVKASMGSEAIILHTRTFQVRSWMGLRRSEVVEITAGKGMNIGDRPGRGGGGSGGGARGGGPRPGAPAPRRAAPAGAPPPPPQPSPPG